MRGLGQRRPLLLAAGEVVGVLAQEGAQLAELRRLGHFFLPLFFQQILVRQHLIEVQLHRLLHKEGLGILGQNPQQSAEKRIRARQIQQQRDRFSAAGKQRVLSRIRPPRRRRVKQPQKHHDAENPVHAHHPVEGMIAAGKKEGGLRPHRLSRFRPCPYHPPRRWRRRRCPRRCGATPSKPSFRPPACRPRTSRFPDH